MSPRVAKDCFYAVFAALVGTSGTCAEAKLCESTRFAHRTRTLHTYIAHAHWERLMVNDGV
ncbi:hypothetical protein [Numidum massiliense]|uniref:hypothetical protein n=1 Tax=Numidum massiliense TaxID=1522315 RepID=UPI0006D5469B|nr:hypothetical protein [Numidum massiliense]